MCTLNKFRRKGMKKKKIIAAMMSAAMLFSVVTPYLPVQQKKRLKYCRRRMRKQSGKRSILTQTGINTKGCCRSGSGRICG